MMRLKQATGDPASVFTESDDRPHTDVERLIDDNRVSRGQWIIMALCAALTLLDGLDGAILYFAAADVARDLSVPVSSFGTVFSASLIGGILGGFIIGPAGDRIGPKRILVVMTLIFALATLATALAGDFFSLIGVRAIAGVGLSGIVPCLVAILSAYTPRRIRATVVTVTLSMQLVGAAIGGALGSWIVPTFGWRMLFVIGGLAPLVLVPWLLWYLSEPLTHLVATDARKRVDSTLRRLGIQVADPTVLTTRIRSTATETSFTTVLLFREGRARATLLLWMAALAGYTFTLILGSWLPTILRAENDSMVVAAYGGVALNAGGLIGSIVSGRLIDRFGPYPIMMLGYLIGGALILSLSAGSMPVPQMLVIIFLGSLFALGAQYSLSALIVFHYPPQLHNTGIANALAFGRCGGVLGPMLGGYIFATTGSAQALFGTAAAAALLSGLCIVVMRRIRH